MKSLLRLEELAMTAAGLYAIAKYGPELSPWVWALLFFAPNLGMLGYLIDTRVGAWLYNIFHHKGIALLVAGIGFCVALPWLIASGFLLFSHASFDRILGYGLKYGDSFKHTHLGWLPNGKER